MESSKCVFNVFIIMTVSLCFVINLDFMSNKNIFYLVFAKENCSQFPLNCVNSSSTYDNNEHEVITIVESYDFSFNIISPTDFISYFTPLSDSTDYLKNFPGFSSMRSGGTNSDIMFRGMFGSRVHILDGSGEIYGACGSRMDSSSAYIFPENFDVVTLIKGPQTVLWGPVASGGIVRFDRENPRFYKSGIKMRTSTMFGSYNRLDKNINTIFGNSFGYLRLIGTMSNSNDYLDAKRHIVPSAWYKWNANMTFGLTPVSDCCFEFTISQSNGNAKYAARGMDAMCFARDSFEIRFKKNSFQDSYSIDFTSWYHHINHVMGIYSNDVNGVLIKKNKFLRNQYDNCVDRLISGFRGILSYQWKDFKFFYGADIQVNQHRKKIANNSWYKDSCFQDTGLFFELDWKFESFTKMISGVRLEHTLVNYYSIHEEKKDRNILYPAGFIRYEHIFSCPNLLGGMYVGVGANERFPDYWELIVLKSGKGMGRDAFYRLKDEKNVQLDVGAHVKSKKIDFWISSYSGYIKDFIVYKYYDESFSTVFSNQSSVENINAITRGSEIGCQYQVNNNLRLESNMSYVFGKNITNGSSLPQIPPFDAKVMLIWGHNFWTGKCTWRLVSSQSRIAPNYGNVISRDVITSKGFSTLSVSLSKQISHEIQLSGGVNNVLNKSYSEHLSMVGNKRFESLSGFPLCEAGRTFWFRIGVIF